MNFLLQLFIYIVLAVVSSLLQSAETQQQRKTPGVRGTRQEGGDNSLAFVVGNYGLAGQFEYGADWGQDGETPNAFHTEVYSLGDLPYNGFTGFFFNGTRGTLLYGEPHGELGIPVAEARVGGVDHLWVKFYDGRQTVADAMLVSRMGSQPGRPYTSDMIFRGCPYAVVTAKVNREVFTSFPTYLFEVQGISLYDPRKDSSVGGLGTQRLANPDSWAYSDDPIVAVYNLFLGIRYKGEWIYGGQTITPYQLPFDIWTAQMAKSTSRGFKCGYEIVCAEVEPHAAIGELLLAGAARIAEIGGIYKVLVAEPGEPVRSFTDEDIVRTADEELDPFPGLEVTCNVISSTYPERAEAWGMKEAPSRFSSALEAEDDGRRLPKSIAYKAVPYALQVQELDKMAVEEARRFRTHIATMPPEWWEMEPLDVEAWTSARNGYGAKRFMITAVDDLPNAHQLVARKEIEPGDYSWSPDMALPWDVAPLGIARPAPQVMTGWNVAPFTVTDVDGTGRRPGIEVFWAAGLLDVRAVAIQVRESWGSKAAIFSGDLPYEVAEPSPSAVPSIASLLPNTLYEVRGKYVPFSGRRTLWSNQDEDENEGPWFGVTTPNVRLGPLDVVYGDIDLSEIGEQAKGLLTWVGSNIRDLIDQAQAQAMLTGDQDLANATQFNEMRRSLSTVAAGLAASFEETITTAIIPMNGQLVAVADALTQLSAADGDALNTARWRMTTTSGPAGSSVIGIETRYNPADSDDYRMSGSYWVTPNNRDDPTRRIEIADQFIIASSLEDITFQPFIFEDGEAKMMAARIDRITAGILEGPATVINLTTGFFSFGAP